MHTRHWFLAAILCLTLPLLAGFAEEPRPEFTRLVAHWIHYNEPGYLTFLEEAQPDVAQVGFYGAHFWGLAHTPQYKGYPAHFPVQGLKECGEWFENLNREVHARKIKVVGHMNVKFLVGDPETPEGPRGFFKFYRDLWDEKELGPRPAANPLDLLEKNADGSPIVQDGYKIGQMKEYWGCLNNPQWRAVLKAWTKRGIERGVDGYIANYFYRHNCLCDHCQQAFKEYLQERFTPQQLQSEFAIANLDQHRFPEIVCWHKPEESTPLRREMLRFSQIANKRAFDEVFVEYGKKFKPGLLVAQWNHLGNFSQISGDERCLLPGDLWGKNEDYLWYSSGASATYTDLPEGFLGDLTLQARYIRGAFDDKPFTLGKYEHTRIRAAISELAANGGAPMGFYTNFTDPAAREEIVRYYQFLKRNDALYRANRPHAEAVLLFPRKAIHAGRVAAVEAFRQAGRKLLERHLLFDVLPDDLATPERLAGYAHVIHAEAPDKILDAAKRSQFELPPTVRVAASRPAGNQAELTLHFVNYNRTEPDKKHSTGRGIGDEQPVECPGGKVSLLLPTEAKVSRLEFLTPESGDAQPVTFERAGERLNFAVPKFLVYGVMRILP
jgi:hypothetical protein